MLAGLPYLTTLTHLASFGLLTWLFADALLLRFESKAALKSLGFALLLPTPFLPSPAHLVFTSLGLLAIFMAFSLENQLSLTTSLILIMFALPFLLPRLSLLVILQSLALILAIFRLAYTTKHRDLIPLGVAFVLFALGQFFLYLNPLDPTNSFAVSAQFIFLFAHLTFLIWWWSYIAIRLQTHQDSFHHFLR